MSRLVLFHAVVLLSALLWAERDAFAQENTFSADTRGTIGLNMIPSARMDEAGTARIGAGHTDPYNHAFIGFQIAKPLYVNLRQSMLVSSAGEKPEMVYPGMDIKLRLKEEGRYAPEIAFGMDSALGHKRFSSEYFALSKRIHDFDFTAGIAWGQLGGTGHLKNPLAQISSHFDQDRNTAGNDAATPADWFTGEKIGLFGGVEYFTPLKGLSLKADFGAREKDFGFESPSPWSAGFNYSPKKWISIGAALIGADKVMARLTFQGSIFDWKGKSYKDSEAFKFDAARSDRTWRNLAREMAEAEKINMGKTRIDGTDFSGVVHLNDYQPSAMQIGRAARHLAANAGKDIETITVIPVIKGLRAKTVTFSRRALEQSIARNLGSPEEIWQDTSFGDDSRSITQKTRTHTFRLNQELSFSPGEEETTHLYRAALVFEEQKEWRRGVTTGTSLRLNAADNLHRLFKFRDVNLESVRGDADLFTMNRVNVDRAFVTFMRTPIPDFHFAATAGYLEEMYAGYGGEVLYRPFDSAFAIGAEGWNAYKRDALSPLALGIWGDPSFTGHLNLYYDIPDTDITAFARVGRFIGGDRGINTGAQMELDSGIKLKGFVSVTNSEDKDAFDSDRNVYGGFQLALPLGNIPYVPQGSEARVKLAPIGRDDAAMIDKPIDLYEATEPMSYRHLGRNWQEVLN